MPVPIAQCDLLWLTFPFSGRVASRNSSAVMVYN